MGEDESKPGFEVAESFLAASRPDFGASKFFREGTKLNFGGTGEGFVSTRPGFVSTRLSLEDTGISCDSPKMSKNPSKSAFFALNQK
jgi:hypothetical protein